MSEQQTTFDYKHVGGRFLGLVAAALAAFAAIFFGAASNPDQFAFSYLFAFTFFFTICMGGLFWILVHHAVDAEWSVVVRRQMENIASMLLVMAILFIPLVFVAPRLWKWMSVPAGQDILLDEKWPYLTPWFFWLRAAFYFAFFVIASTWLRANSILQDKDGAPRYTVFNRKITFASLPLFAVCLTFSAIDWLMGLDYHWFSTMWGVYIFAGTALSSMCVLVLLITALRGAGYFGNVISMEHYHTMGKLMFAFTVFWAYIGFSQYMLIWYANIPEETVYFLRRNTESWQILSTALVVGHFFVPFLLLLPNPGKRKPAYLCGMAVWILLMHMLDIYVVVLPALHKAGVVVSWMDFACLAAIGCTLAAVFLKRLGDAPLWPLRDPRLPQSIALKN
ncbi:MAG: hypothetical protein D4R65_04895 [Verrucomicrobiaceae bacterium]|nr:MAG: hypothetical protein D4R65_04895 [Verrucomicrobiaceae bacterium]